MEATKVAAHTPGPWTADGRLVVDGRADAVAMVNIARPVSVAHCDAALIAAAPDLLAALCKLSTERIELYATGDWRGSREEEDRVRQLFEEARAAIAKAQP